MPGPSTGAPPVGGGSRPQQLVVTFSTTNEVGAYGFKFDATVYVPEGARNTRVMILRADNFLKEVPRTAAQRGVEKFETRFVSTDLLRPGDEASRGTMVYAALDIVATADGAEGFSGQTLLALACPGGELQAVCNGVCNDLLADAQNCGECGRACTSSIGAGTCLAGKCTWSLETPVPASCNSVCGKITGAPAATGCVARCGLDAQGRADPGGGGYLGLVTYSQNGVAKPYSMPDCFWVPNPVDPTGNGTWTAQSCCCGDPYDR